MSVTRADLERQLLRKGLGALVSGRPTCADCGRTPLTGEHVHVYDNDAIVCALCRPRRREDPRRTELVHHCEHGHAVRPAARAA